MAVEHFECLQCVCFECDTIEVNRQKDQPSSSEKIMVKQHLDVFYFVLLLPRRHGLFALCEFAATLTDRQLSRWPGRHACDVTYLPLGTLLRQQGPS